MLYGGDVRHEHLREAAFAPMCLEVCYGHIERFYLDVAEYNAPPSIRVDLDGETHADDDIIRHQPSFWGHVELLRH